MPQKRGTRQVMSLHSRNLNEKWGHLKKVEKPVGKGKCKVERNFDATNVTRSRGNNQTKQTSLFSFDIQRSQVNEFSQMLPTIS